MIFFGPLKRRPTYVGTKGVSGYGRYRDEIAEDCKHRCVYCDHSEKDLGGPPMMELDHLRPQSSFKDLEKSPTNLLYACRSCNGKKGNDWPAGKSERTYENGIGYVDPFKESRAEFFAVSACGRVQPREDPAKYVIERLGLNRSLLQLLRQRRFLAGRLRQIIVDVEPRVNTALENPDADSNRALRDSQIVMRLTKKVLTLCEID